MERVTGSSRPTSRAVSGSGPEPNPADPVVIRLSLVERTWTRARFDGRL